MNDFSFFLPISKVEAQADGSRLVSGYASTPTKDLDGEIISLDAIKNALPEYMEWGNIRYMHQPDAVGRAKEANTDERGLFLTAKIVDPVCIVKIDEKVLQGFSIGGRKVSQKGDTITELELIEISVVDRPANPDCRFVALGKSASPGVSLIPRETQSEGEIVISAAEAGPLRKFFSRLFGKGGDAPGEGDKPYGSVEYADPGYQADGKKRYPIDSEKHIRAAWSYINKPKNQKPYSDEQVSKIKAKIVSAWKAKIDKDGPPSADSEKAAKADELKKGLWALGSLARIVEDLEMLRQTSLWEENYEADGSDMPGRLKTAVEGLCEALRAMAVEETSEIEQGHAGEGVMVIMDSAYAAMADADKLALLKHAPDLAKKFKPDPAAVTGGTSPEDDRPPFEQLKEHLEMANLDEIFARMAARNDVGKRGASGKAHMAKAAHHLGKAMECAKSAHGHFGKAAGCMMEHVKAQKAAGVNKAAGEEHVTAAMGHMASGNAKMEEMADHHDLAQHYMGKAAGGEGDNVGGGASEVPGNEVGGSSRARGQGELTEGDVPGYDPHNPYPNKAAGYTKEIVDALVAAAAKAANAEGQLEVMKRMPASAGPKAARFAEIGKAFAPGTGAGDQPNALAELFKDVNINPADPEQAKSAATTMIANMYRNPRIFAKSLADPSFRGTGGVRH